MKSLKKKGIIANEAIQLKLDSVQKEVNSRLSSFCRITRTVLRDEPFERTPTDKIKRFLYQNDNCGQCLVQPAGRS